jgi:hypothetical protein
MDRRTQNSILVARYRRATLASGFFVGACMLALPFFARAQESLSMTITPPLFQIVASAGDVWQSSVKVVNTNDYDITVFASVVDFGSIGEEGHAQFIPILADENVNPHSLAKWITLPAEGVAVPRGQSAKIPFTVTVPNGAEPGGHYAAILIGTHPIGERTKGASVSVSSLVSSLLFMRVPGDIREAGDIREFTTTKNVYSDLEAAFVMRFENKGNVHVLPQGVITITNMWGKERGIIPINEATDFGNVLPNSTRKYEFSWKGDYSIFEAGRYKAIATLVFGADARQSVSRTTYFWFIPIVPMLLILGGLLGSLFVIVWGVRTYIRKALAMEMARRGVAPHAETLSQKAATTLHMLGNPMRESAHDFESAILHKEASAVLAADPRPRSFFEFFRKYHRAFALVPLVIIALALIGIYIAAAFSGARSYEIQVSKDGGQAITISSERIIKDELSRDSSQTQYAARVDIASDIPRIASIDIMNMGGEPGRAARAALMLESQGFAVHDLFREKEEISVSKIFYRTEDMRVYAENFSRALAVQPDLVLDGSLGTDIRIALGADFRP